MLLVKQFGGMVDAASHRSYDVVTILLRLNTSKHIGVRQELVLHHHLRRCLENQQVSDPFLLRFMISRLRVSKGFTVQPVRSCWRQREQLDLSFVRGRYILTFVHLIKTKLKLNP